MRLVHMVGYIVVVRYSVGEVNCRSSFKAQLSVILDVCLQPHVGDLKTFLHFTLHAKVVEYFVSG